MQYKVYSVIEVGAYGASLNVYEISRKNGIRVLDTLRYPLDVGKDTYSSGKISRETIMELCTILKEFSQRMKEYQSDDYIAFATNALREAVNSHLVLSQIKSNTGVDILLYSNSEIRFISYKAIALKQDDFEKIIQKGTAIVDVGGGSVQVSVYDKDNLITTQNLQSGSLRIREQLAAVRRESTDYEALITEMVSNDVAGFRKMHLKDRKISNVILLGDYFSGHMLRSQNSGLSPMMSAREYEEWVEQIIHLPLYEQASRMGMAAEYASLLIPTAVLYKTFIEEFGAEMVWIPGVEIADGFAYDYAEKNRLIKSAHNFENDIVMAARNIGKRYAVSKANAAAMDQFALAIFDSLRRSHGLTQRDRLLLEIAVLLHDCGKYISMSQVGDCSFNIIMATEIIGLSHREREIIAWVVRYNKNPFGYHDEMSSGAGLAEEDYVRIAKLTAILRFANALDRAHKQKIEDIKITQQEQKLIVRLQTRKDFSLEQGLLGDKLDFFEEVFNIRPEIRLKKLV